MFIMLDSTADSILKSQWALIPFKETLCRIHTWSFYATVSISANLVLTLAVERFYATYFPFKYQEQSSVSNTNKVSFGCVLVGLLLASPLASIHAIDGGHTCFGLADYMNETVAVTAMMFQRYFVTFTPLLLMCVLNALIVIRIFARPRSKRLVNDVKQFQVFF